MYINKAQCLKQFAGGTGSHGIGRLSNEVTATFATQHYLCGSKPQRNYLDSTSFLRLKQAARRASRPRDTNEQSAWKSLNYCWNAVCTIAGSKLSKFK